MLATLAQEKGTVHPLWPIYEGALRNAKVPLERLRPACDGTAAAIDVFDGQGHFILAIERYMDYSLVSPLSRVVDDGTRQICHMSENVLALAKLLQV